MNSHPLGALGIKAFEARGISVETASRFGVYTARTTDDGSVIPDYGGNVVVFPFWERGVSVAEKYRAPGKRFWQRKGGKRTFWNSDALDDPALEAGTYPLIITEGEIDALTAIDCGFPLTVSVPDGAPAVREGENPDELPPASPDDEPSGKFEFVWLNRDRLRRVKKFVLAVDNDAPGQRLAAEMLRRLGAARCSFIAYPEGCKDLSDVRQRFGAEAVAKCLNGAKPYPVKGLYRLSDYPDHPDPQTFGTGFAELDEYLRLWLGELMIVTGIPASGKSTFVLSLCANLADSYGWSTAIASFEIATVPALRHKLRLTKTRTPASQWTRGLIETADAWINKYFLFIDDDPNGESDDEMTLEWALERAADAVIRAGISVLVIDPWNEIEHYRPKGESETEYHNRALRMIRRFAQRYQVVAIVVAHPTKEVAGTKDGKSRIPTMYDISGSAAWFNKPDHGIVVDVPDPNSNETVIWVKKARFSWSGKRGDVTLRYEPEIECYSSLEGLRPMWKSAIGQ